MFNENDFSFFSSESALVSELMTILDAIKDNPSASWNLPPQARKDRNFMLYAVELGGADVFPYASQALRDDCDFFLDALELNGGVLRHALPIYQSDRALVLDVIERGGADLFQYASEGLRSDTEYVLVVVGRAGAGVIEHVPGKLKDSRDFMLAAVELGGADVFQYASELLKDHSDLILEVLERVGSDGFQHASQRLKSDEDYVLGAVKQAGADVLQWASHTLLGNSNFMLRAVELNADAINYLPKRLQDDADFMRDIEVIKQNGADSALLDEHASTRFRL